MMDTQYPKCVGEEMTTVCFNFELDFKDILSENI
jgi:hypothetical protein